MKKRKLNTNLRVRSFGAGIVAVAFCAYGVGSSVAQAAQAKNIQNAASSSIRGIYLKDGTFTGTAQGYGGKTTVDVTVTNGYITDVGVTKTYDDSPYIDNVESKLIPDLIAEQTTTIDVVSGASYSSNGVRYAVRDALRTANAMPESEEAAIAALPTNKQTFTDTLSIGYLVQKQEKEERAQVSSGFAGRV